MLKKPSRSLTSNTCLAVQSPSLSRCGLPRKRRSKKESAEMTDKQSSSLTHSSVKWVVISLSIKATNIVLRRRVEIRIISPVKEEIRADTRITEVVIAEAEAVSEVVWETKTIKALLAQDKLLLSQFPSYRPSLFLRLILLILPILLSQMTERLLSVMLSTQLLSRPSVSTLLVASLACWLTRMLSTSPLFCLTLDISQLKPMKLASFLSPLSNNKWLLVLPWTNEVH